MDSKKISGYAFAMEYMVYVTDERARTNIQFLVKVNSEEKKVTIGEGESVGYVEVSKEEIAKVRKDVEKWIVDGSIYLPSMFTIKDFTKVDDEAWEITA